MHRRLFVFACAIAIASPSWAQDHGAHRHAQPYAGQQMRAIKALTPEQIADLEKGAGMTLALAAELNGFPGPKHAVELAGPLGLSDTQRARLEALTAKMTADAKAIGARIVEAERRLDRAFAEGKIDRESLTERTREIAGLMGDLRGVHLATHLETKALLTADQNAAYAKLRGYATN